MLFCRSVVKRAEVMGSYCPGRVCLNRKVEQEVCIRSDHSLPNRDRVWEQAHQQWQGVRQVYPPHWDDQYVCQVSTTGLMACDYQNPRSIWSALRSFYE